MSCCSPKCKQASCDFESDYLCRHPVEATTSRYVQFLIPDASCNCGARKRAKISETPDCIIIKQLEKNIFNRICTFTKQFVCHVAKLIPKILEEEIKEHKPTPDKGKYGYVFIKESKKGQHTFILDETKDNKRIVLQHIKGTYIRMIDNKDLIIKTMKDGYEFIHENKKIYIKKNKFTLIDGDDKIEIKKSMFERVHKNRETCIEGDSMEKVKGSKHTDVQGTYTVYINGQMAVLSNTEIRMNAPIIKLNCSC